ncbi:MAG: NfeD family protein [Candidatus Eisenbacteria bacterium]|nr:NfeD family protein [Candidatus Eisenbacteria bacterium]
MGEFTGLVQLLEALFRFFGLGPGAIMAGAGLLILFFVIFLPLSLAAQSRRISTGRDGMVGLTGAAATDLAPQGRVYVHSEYWNAVADTDVPAGTAIEVVSVDGMLLHVRPVG